MRTDPRGFTDTDIAALRGLGGPNDAEIEQLRGTRDALIAQIRAIFEQRPDLRGRQPVSLDTKAQNLIELRGVVQRLQTALAWLQAQVAAGSGASGGSGGSGGGGGGGSSGATVPNAAEIEQLRGTRDALIAQIRAIFEQRPDLRGRQPVSLDTKAQNLIELRGVVQRLQTALAWLQAQVAAGSSGGGGSLPATNSAEAEIAALRAVRDQLIQVLRIAWQARPDLRAKVPVNLDTKAQNIAGLRDVVARLRRAVQWLEAQPELTAPSGQASAAAATTPAAVARPASFSPQDWSVWARVSPSLSAPTWGRPPTPPPTVRRWTSSSTPCGMGSWLSKAFKKITGTNLSTVVAPIAQNIPYVGGIVSNIVAGSPPSGNQIAQSIAQTVGLTPAQVQAIAAGKPCQAVSADKRAACQAEIVRIADALRTKYKAAAGAAPCAHLPAAMKQICQSERRSAWERLVYAMNTNQPVPVTSFAPLSAQEQASAAAAAAPTSAKMSGPLMLAAAGVGVLALAGRGRG